VTRRRRENTATKAMKEKEGEELRAGFQRVKTFTTGMDVRRGEKNASVSGEGNTQFVRKEKTKKKGVQTW